MLEITRSRVMISSDIERREILLDTPAGRLFAKRWCCAAPDVEGRAPLVLLHDSLGSVELWRDFPEKLAAACLRPVVAYDRLGFGRSDPRPASVPLDFIAEEARIGFQQLKAALQIDRFAIFGHSVGGGMSVAIAAAFPKECEALIAVSAQAFVEDRTVAGILAAREAFAVDGQLERLKRYHGEKASWVLSAWIDRWLDPAFADWSLDAVLPRVQCPSLVLHGVRDEYGSTRHPERIAALSQGPSKMVIGDWGHVPYREAPEQVTRLVAEWLRAVPAETSD